MYCWGLVFIVGCFFLAQELGGLESIVYISSNHNISILSIWQRTRSPTRHPQLQRMMTTMEWLVQCSPQQRNARYNLNHALCVVYCTCWCQFCMQPSRIQHVCTIHPFASATNTCPPTSRFWNMKLPTSGHSPAQPCMSAATCTGTPLPT